MADKQENVEVSGAKTVSGNKILSIKVTRNNSDGLQFWLQSNIDWSFLARADKSMVNYHGVVCYKYREQRIPGINGLFVLDNGYFEYEGMPNLQLLLGKDIKNGVRFSFGVLPFHEDKATEFINSFKEQVKSIYFAYVSPINIMAEFSSQIIERAEVHN